MKAYLISPETQAIEETDVSSEDDIKSLVGFDTLESDELNVRDTRLYFDDECFLRGASGPSTINRGQPWGNSDVRAELSLVCRQSPLLYESTPSTCGDQGIGA